MTRAKQHPKRLLQGATLAIPALVIAALIMTAQSLWVPVPKDRYEDCFYAAKQSGNKHPDCRLYETIWERGLVDPTAYYTLWLTLFTGVLAAVGIAGTVFGLQQIKLARDEFNASHRPRLVVREVEVNWVLNVTEISFVIINEGDADAHNIKCDFRMREYFDFVDAARHPIEIGEDQIPETLSPGKFIECKGNCSVNMPALADGRRKALAADQTAMNVAFEGTATYSGPTNVGRRSRYYRPFDFSIVGFRSGDNPEREYPG